MENGINRLMIDLVSIVSTIAPEADLTKMTFRFEEALTNYDVKRKTIVEMEDDLPEKIGTYLSAKRLEGLAPGTLKDYQMELYLFCGQCKLPAAQVSTSTIRSYLSGIDGVMSSTIGKKLSVLKSFFGWLVEEEYILRDPTKKIKTPKTPKRLPKGLSVEELEMVRESCIDLRERALVEVFYSTGCRLSEVASMDIADVDMQSMSMKVVGKGDKERVVYLSHKCLYHLSRYLKSRKDDSEALFATQKRPLRRMGNAAIQQVVDKIEKRSGIMTKLHPHVFRHSFATSLMNRGIDLADLQQLLGHSSPATSMVYTEVSEERKQQAHKRYHAQ